MATLKSKIDKALVAALLKFALLGADSYQESARSQAAQAQAAVIPARPRSRHRARECNAIHPSSVRTVSDENRSGL